MERVDLERERHAERQLWHNGDLWDEHAAKVAVGRLRDGRWYARIYAGGRTVRGERITCAYAGPHAEHLARGAARRWMRTNGGWWLTVQAGGGPTPTP